MMKHKTNALAVVILLCFDVVQGATGQASVAAAVIMDLHLLLPWSPSRIH
jgi:hypothetical protein